MIVDCGLIDGDCRQPLSCENWGRLGSRYGGAEVYSCRYPREVRVVFN